MYLLVDDTTFLAEKTADMNRILAAYNNFVKKWRIGINASKCKALQNEHVSVDLGWSDSVYMLGGSEINKVQTLKYNKGARAHDKAKEAEATQSRFKLRTTGPSWERVRQQSNSGLT